MCLVCFSIFDYSKKWIKATLLSFVIKMKCGRTFEMLAARFSESTMSRTLVQLLHNWFKEGREDVNDDVYIRARQQPMKT